ncbi:hypothetical protein ISN44_As01g064530 [Arabidopsis suecica]|jgi:uncharacterized coiled-coil protein SlyX|uniref:At1g74860 n=2 Tax=Arabidopsis TaxID=3701 RepID=Q9SSG6_ARATH|nr:uncharacterized protein AT1G74860 [Arabidopsis thaliana]AAD55290.1 F25A4.17 [Arabidopsis thaliana]ABF58972.1 At1g74860 [Arabidopsis thaliana]AEE35640.1 hypothetical protein AT1G74860 [Arabidopsis thaliana]KAG7659596.1 hypothetical protein ISN44_As01g064530 [Arabidopsis suecica]|eukprot:NP_565092.1 hypothetical protein AT1G74860 [Arabidopsis thaliana]
MADPETLAALKRAYADTILNTTKEAAARVMVSEKKARRYQQELVTVRNEALHTLVRLKQMLDSKVKETEMQSLKQQQKVEELEAQLGEAEDIVGELRLELRVLHDELKKLTDGQKHLKKNHEENLCWNNRDAAVSVMPEVSCSHENTEAVGFCIPVEQNGSVVANGIKVPSLTRINSINRCSYKDNKDQCHYTLPSILTKRRETEGLAQMIHTVDSSMANGVLSSSVEVGDVNDGVCLHEVSSCKIVESLEMSGCADATDSISSVKDGEAPIVSPNSSQKDVGTLISLKTSPPREHENDRKLEISETEARKEEKESCENMEVSASPLCEETPVLALSKNRCIKYTFKRKRKKEVLSNLEGDSSFEESRNMKQKTVEKDDGYLESLKPSFTSESSRDVVYA